MAHRSVRIAIWAIGFSDNEIQTLRRWIQQGAQWNSHWSFVPPGETPVPQVADEDWPRNEIGHFILARLEREMIEPSPQADPERLIRWQLAVRRNLRPHCPSRF